jgi:hypothetical protein
MKIGFTQIATSRDDAIVKAGAAKRDDFKVVIVGPVKIVRYGNKAGGQADMANSGDSDVWIVVATDSTIDTSLLG